MDLGKSIINDEQYMLSNKIQLINIIMILKKLLGNKKKLVCLV